MRHYLLRCFPVPEIGCSAERAIRSAQSSSATDIVHQTPHKSSHSTVSLLPTARGSCSNVETMSGVENREQEVDVIEVAPLARATFVKAAAAAAASALMMATSSVRPSQAEDVAGAQLFIGKTMP